MNGGGGDNAFGENFTQGSLIAHKPFYIEISKDDDMIYVKRYTDSSREAVKWRDRYQEVEQFVPVWS